MTHTPEKVIFRENAQQFQGQNLDWTLYTSKPMLILFHENEIKEHVYNRLFLFLSLRNCMNVDFIQISKTMSTKREATYAKTVMLRPLILELTRGETTSNASACVDDASSTYITK